MSGFGKCLAPQQSIRAATDMYNNVQNPASPGKDVYDTKA